MAALLELADMPSIGCSIVVLALDRRGDSEDAFRAVVKSFGWMGWRPVTLSEMMEDIKYGALPTETSDKWMFLGTEV